MSWLLFMDESGHDHKQMPYEVRGGIAIQDRRLWSFIRAVESLERDCFGVRLADYRKEFKGEKLLDKDRLKWAFQDTWQSDAERRSNVRAFLSKGLQKAAPRRCEFTAYGQGCFEMAQGVFRLLREHDAKVFAAAIPRGAKPPDTFEAQEYLRKDQVFLLERFYHFVRREQEQGLIVMDQVEERSDARFLNRLTRYFTKTAKGTQRADWIVPSPFFVASHLSVPVQAADLCIYCINWGFRRPKWGMNAETRAKIEEQFSGWIDRLEWVWKTRWEDGTRKTMHGIIFVQNPYGSGEP